MTKCSVIIPCRDGQDHLMNTLASLIAQTVDVHITVVDDHSQDNTQNILASFPSVNHIRYPKREKKGYHRVGMLVNMALGSIPKAEYYMVSGDDTEFPPFYIELVTALMERDNVHIASGHARGPTPTGAPDGSGRIFTSQAWALLTPFHESPAWESGPLLLAQFMGLGIDKYPVKKIHLRPQAKGSLRRFGHGAYTLGRPVLWTVLRVLKDIFRGNKSKGRALSILIGHLEYKFKRKPQVDYADLVKAHCRTKMKDKLKEVLRWPFRIFQKE